MGKNVKITAQTNWLSWQAKGSSNEIGSKKSQWVHLQLAEDGCTFWPIFGAGSGCYSLILIFAPGCWTTLNDSRRREVTLMRCPIPRGVFSSLMRLFGGVMERISACSRDVFGRLVRSIFF